MSQRKSGDVLSLLAAAFVLACTVQALYWPLLPKPGLVLDWWQVEWLAKLGYLLGFPVLLLSRWVGGHVLLVAAVLWSGGVFLLLIYSLRRLGRRDEA